MSGITVKGADAAGGAQLGGGQSLMTVDGMQVVVDGDPVTGHGQSPHNAPVMVASSDWFTIDGKKVVKAGDLATCGHATSGQPWFDIPD